MLCITFSAQLTEWSRHEFPLAFRQDRRVHRVYPPLRNVKVLEVYLRGTINKNEESLTLEVKTFSSSVILAAPA